MLVCILSNYMNKIIVRLISFETGEIYFLHWICFYIYTSGLNARYFHKYFKKTFIIDGTLLPHIYL